MIDQELLTRFAGGHDKPALAALVERHGPLVLSVCQRILNDSHDAEDAFQATFLVLARKATSIRKQDSLSSWTRDLARRDGRPQGVLGVLKAVASGHFQAGLRLRLSRVSLLGINCYANESSLFSCGTPYYNDNIGKFTWKCIAK